MTQRETHPFITQLDMAAQTLHGFFAIVDVTGVPRMGQGRHLLTWSLLLLRTPSIRMQHSVKSLGHKYSLRVWSCNLWSCNPIKINEWEG